MLKCSGEKKKKLQLIPREDKDNMIKNEEMKNKMYAFPLIIS